MTKQIPVDNVVAVRDRLMYSQAIKVGNTIYMSGQVSLDVNGKVIHKGDFTGQLRHAFECIRRILEAAGAGMADVVKLNYYMRNVRDLGQPEVADILREYFGEHRPCNTAVEVVSLWHPYYLVEVEAIAVVGEEQTIIGS